MSTTIDQRVVEMRFDNQHFEKNVSSTMSSLDKLKRSLNLTGSSKGFDELNASARRVDLSGLRNGVETIGLKFNAMYSIADQVLRNITNRAMYTGERMIKALTIDPIKTGFQEYETQINAVQTILANTQSKGTTITDVNGALDELNSYADKTIYNFTEMTRNIGTFTAAGVDLDKSVTSIKGIANLAAVSGSTSQQASTAMYQLSQALAAGKVQLMDWNSVVNAGMGGQVFQDALKRTAKNMGKDVDGMIKKYGSFRESLTQGEWLTADVLTETLTQLSGAYTEADLLAKGYSKEQAKEILELAKTAEDAATKVKTFTQLWDTLKEAAQSGWTQTWEIIVGDFEEAKALLTSISDVVGAFINKTAEARNNLLQGWKDAGGRTDLIDGLTNIFEHLANVIKPIGEAFKEIFPSLKVEQLTAITDGFKNFTEKLVVTAETSDQLKRTFKGVFSIFSIVGKALGAVAVAIGKLITSDGVKKLASFFLDITATIGDFFTSINSGFDSKGLTGVLSGIVDFISDIFGTAVTHIQTFGDLLSAVGDVISNVAGKIWESLKEVFGWFSETFSAGDVFAGLAGGGIFVAGTKIAGFLGKIIDIFKDLFDGGIIGALFGGKKEDAEKAGASFKELLGSVQDTLSSFTTGIKVGSVVAVAVAIGILSASLKTISGINTGSVIKSLAAIGTMMGILSWGLSSINKTLTKPGIKGKGIAKASFSLILVATALNILAKAMEKIGKLSFPEIVKGLIGIGGGLTALSVGLKIIGEVKIPLSTSVAMVALAGSCSILGDAFKKFSGLSWAEIGRGLTGMGGALTEFVAVLMLMDKFTGFNSVVGSAALLIAVQSLSDLADGLKKFGEMSWTEIGHGLSGMGGALGEMTGALTILGKFAGFSSLFAAGSIAIVVNGLSDTADALKKFGSMSWEEIGRGLTGMGGALIEVSGVTGALGKIAGISSLFASGAIVITIQGLAQLADAMKSFGGMMWDEIARGLTGMGGALGEVALITGTLGKLSGLSGLLGSGTILLGVQDLGKLADALKKFGEMSWDEIGRGLTAMGGALTELAIVTGGLGALAGLPSLLGSGSLLLAVQDLGKLADALKKFGEMSWDEIGRGLTAMGAALGETALGGLLNTFSGLGALSISEMADSLGILADSVKKWTGVTVPENLGTNLGTLAAGVEKFTLAGFGSDALATSAPAVGILAESVQKWSGVSVPEKLGEKLAAMAEGVKEFTWVGMGASALASAAPAIGTLADGVKKWDGVTVPENIQSNMTSLATGIKAFSFAFVGGWSIKSLVGPLGELPASISKWSNVSVPETIKSGLESLAKGVKAFNFAFTGGWSMSAVVGPLGDMAGSVKKWANVTVPEGLGDNLKSLADGIKPFSKIGDISSAAGNISALATSFKELSSVGFKSITDGLSGLSELIETETSGFDGLGEKLMKSLSDGITKGQATLKSSVTAMISDMLNRLKSASSKMQSTGTLLMTRFISGMTSQRSKIPSVIAFILSSATANIRSYYSSFYSAGSYLVDGIAAGIDANDYKAVAKARAMAEAAIEAARKALGIKSPSKEFYKIGNFAGQGFTNALGDYGVKTYRAGSELADSAKKGLSKAISKISDAINSDIDAQPTIRPVLDLSNIRSGAGAINGMLNGNSRIGAMASVNAISSSMHRNQNGANGDVVSAINKLRKDLGNMSNTTYSINGITYDDGTNVSEAIKTIIRAVRIEGRV